MRFSRFLLLPAVTLAVAACGDDDGVSVNSRPPLGGVRYINAVADGGPVDIHMIDQVEWSASSVSNGTNYGLPFRAATPHQATEAKARHIRVFPTDSAFAETSKILHDTTITIEANKNVTLMLVGSRAANDLRFVMIDDTPPALTGNQIAVRTVNAGASASVDGYITADTTSAIAGAPSWGGVAVNTAGAYITRETGLFAVQSVAAGTTASPWRSRAPAGAPADGLISAIAGYAAPGSVLSAYVFPRSVAGSKAPQSAAFQAPAVVFFVDRVPAPVVAGSGN